MSRVQRLAARIGTVCHSMLGSRAGNRLGILLYHRTQPAINGLPEPPFNVTPEAFREQIAGLVARGYQFITLDEALEAHRLWRALPPKTVVLTFDDGFASVHKHAFPVLREFDVPATVFLATSFIDQQQTFAFDAWSIAHRQRLTADDYRPLNLAECREMMASSLVAFGAHTDTHQDFRGRAATFRWDVLRSVESIRDWFQLEEVSFAFPYGRAHLGYAGGEMTTAVRAAGASCALTTDCRLVDVRRHDPFAWGRFNCYQHDTAATLAAKLAGWYAWAPALQVAIDRLRGRRGPVSSEEESPESQDIADVGLPTGTPA